MNNPPKLTIASSIELKITTTSTGDIRGTTEHITAATFLRWLERAPPRSRLTYASGHVVGDDGHRGELLVLAEAVQRAAQAGQVVLTQSTTGIPGMPRPFSYYADKRMEPGKPAWREGWGLGDR
jgi:hypothetical protein